MLLTSHATPQTAARLGKGRKEEQPTAVSLSGGVGSTPRLPALHRGPSVPASPGRRSVTFTLTHDEEGGEERVDGGGDCDICTPRSDVHGDSTSGPGLPLQRGTSPPLPGTVQALSNRIPRRRGAVPANSRQLPRSRASAEQRAQQTTPQSLPLALPFPPSKSVSIPPLQREPTVPKLERTPVKLQRRQRAGEGEVPPPVDDVAAADTRLGSEAFRDVPADTASSVLTPAQEAMLQSKSLQRKLLQHVHDPRSSLYSSGRRADRRSPLAAEQDDDSSSDDESTEPVGRGGAGAQRPPPRRQREVTHPLFPKDTSANIYYGSLIALEADDGAFLTVDPRTGVVAFQQPTPEWESKGVEPFPTFATCAAMDRWMQQSLAQKEGVAGASPRAGGAGRHSKVQPSTRGLTEAEEATPPIPGHRLPTTGLPAGEAASALTVAPRRAVQQLVRAALDATSALSQTGRPVTPAAPLYIFRVIDLKNPKNRGVVQYGGPLWLQLVSGPGTKGWSSGAVLGVGLSRATEMSSLASGVPLDAADHSQPALLDVTTQEALVDNRIRERLAEADSKARSQAHADDGEAGDGSTTFLTQSGGVGDTQNVPAPDSSLITRHTAMNAPEAETTVSAFPLYRASASAFTRRPRAVVARDPSLETALAAGTPWHVPPEGVQLTTTGEQRVVPLLDSGSPRSPSPSAADPSGRFGGSMRVSHSRSLSAGGTGGAGTALEGASHGSPRVLAVTGPPRLPRWTFSATEAALLSSLHGKKRESQLAPLLDVVGNDYGVPRPVPAFVPGRGFPTPSNGGSVHGPPSLRNPSGLYKLGSPAFEALVGDMNAAAERVGCWTITAALRRHPSNTRDADATPDQGDGALGPAGGSDSSSEDEGTSFIGNVPVNVSPEHARDVRNMDVVVLSHGSLFLASHHRKVPPSTQHDALAVAAVASGQGHAAPARPGFPAPSQTQLLELLLPQSRLAFMDLHAMRFLQLASRDSPAHQAAMWRRLHMVEQGTQGLDTLAEVAQRRHAALGRKLKFALKDGYTAALHQAQLASAYQKRFGLKRTFSHIMKGERPKPTLLRRRSSRRSGRALPGTQSTHPTLKKASSSTLSLASTESAAAAEADQPGQTSTAPVEQGHSTVQLEHADAGTVPHMGPRGHFTVHRRGMLRLRLIAISEGNSVGASSLQMAAAAAAAASVSPDGAPPQAATLGTSAAAGEASVEAGQTARAGAVKPSLSTVVNVVAARSAGAGMAAPVGQIEILASHQLRSSKRQRHGHSDAQLRLASSGYRGSHHALLSATVGGGRAADQAERFLSNLGNHNALPQVQRGAHRQSLAEEASARDTSLVSARGPGGLQAAKAQANASRAASAMAAVLSKSESAGLLGQAVSATPRSPKSSRPTSATVARVRVQPAKLSYLEGGQYLAPSMHKHSVSVLRAANEDFVRAVLRQQRRLSDEHGAPSPTGVEPRSPSRASGEFFNFSTPLHPPKLPHTAASPMTALMQAAKARPLERNVGAFGEEAGSAPKRAAPKLTPSSVFLSVSKALSQTDRQVVQALAADEAQQEARKAKEAAASLKQQPLVQAKELAYSSALERREARRLSAQRKGHATPTSVGMGGIQEAAPTKGTSAALERGLLDDDNVQEVLNSVPVDMRSRWDAELHDEARTTKLMQDMRERLEQHLHLPGVPGGGAQPVGSVGELLKAMPKSPTRGVPHGQGRKLLHGDEGSVSPMRAGDFARSLAEEDEHMHFIIGLEARRAQREEGVAEPAQHE